MLGAAAPHFVVDRGTGIEFDTVVVEKREFPTTGGDLSKLSNVLLLAQYNRDETLDRVAGNVTGCDRWLMVEEGGPAVPGGRIPLTSVVCAPSGTQLPSFVEVRDEVVFERIGDQLTAKYVKPGEPIRVANAKYVGRVGAGDDLTWYRPEGWMRLQVMAPVGDQGDAAPFFVKAGRTYDVHYRISTLTFSSTIEVVEE